MENKIKEDNYELQIYFYLLSIYKDHEIFLWNYVPIKYLIELEFIKNNVEDIKKITQVKDIGCDILMRNTLTNKFIFVQCKNYNNKNICISDLVEFAFMLLNRSQVDGIIMSNTDIPENIKKEIAVGKRITNLVVLYEEITESVEQNFLKYVNKINNKNMPFQYQIDAYNCLVDKKSAIYHMPYIDDNSDNIIEIANNYKIDATEISFNDKEKINVDEIIDDNKTKELKCDNSEFSSPDKHVLKSRKKTRKHKINTLACTYCQELLKSKNEKIDHEIFCSQDLWGKKRNDESIELVNENKLLNEISQNDLDELNLNNITMSIEDTSKNNTEKVNKHQFNCVDSDFTTRYEQCLEKNSILQNNINELQNKHVIEIKELMLNHNTEIRNLHDKSENTLKEVTNKHENILKELNNKHENVLKELNIKYENSRTEYIDYLKNNSKQINNNNLLKKK